jgi:hypothetical protein
MNPGEDCESEHQREFERALEHIRRHIQKRKITKLPIADSGDALFSVENDTGRGDDEIFVQVIGRDNVFGKDFFGEYAPDGTCARSFPVDGADSKPFAYPLSHFSNKALYLPAADGTRLYVSVGGKLHFMVNSTINAPNPHDPSEESNLLLWDKIEFNVSPASVFVNPTAVDSFALPIRVRETLKDGTVLEGGATFSRSEASAALSKALASEPWRGLIANEGRVVFAPNDGARTGLFPPDFLETTGWLDAFFDAFSTKNISIDAEESFPPSAGGGIWRGAADEAARTLTLRRDVDASHPAIAPIVLRVPSAIFHWLSGAGDAWGASSDLERALVRNLSAAFDANVLFTTEPLGKKYFETVRADFYKPNPAAPSALNFVDEYSKALHSLGDGRLYTVPYDDELGQCGAVSCSPQNFKSGLITFGKL